ncbi:hypothetical protein [Frigidibacter sp. ROC022]|uniref:hypothetical protein n=1 Tax=Frigidibacter sp. ROC022 TaxID=2971796 RepID=UPI00215B3AD0|nr:hypothetical protein [Frigidibacter sp. ROC022]MCR8723473.1 hypothetical protein [Frigidibacter sp. ROC022]
MPLSRRTPVWAVAGLVALGLAGPAAAQQQKTTLLDLISPDRIVARMMQMGIMSLRTQMDLTYGAISASALTGSVTLTDIKAWPLVDWEIEEGCAITIDRLTLRTVPLDELDLVRIKAQATGAEATLDCLPPEARAGGAMLGIDKVALSRMTVDLDYRISTAGAKAHVYALADGLAAISADVDLDYIWMDGTRRMDDPEPVVFLNSASLKLENLGAWEKLSPMVPPPMLDAAQFGPMIDQGLNGMLGLAPGEPVPPALAEFSASAKEAWSAFLADPRSLVLETGFPNGAARYLNLMDWEGSLDTMLSDLEPHMALRTQPARSMLPVALISKALDAPDTLDLDERVTVGTAFATGIGAPRDLATAETLLGPAVDAGNGSAALVLARAVETRDPEKAYALALLAAERGTEGAAGVLDRIEAALPFAKVLELQGVLVEGIEHPVEALEQLTSVRDEASKRMTGKGRTRSYEVAALWAMIGSAAGDQECADILAEIDEKVRLAGPDAADVWAAQEANAVELARGAWVGFDLPSSFGGVH